MRRWTGAPIVTDNGIDYVTISDAARVTGVSEAMIRYWIKKGLLRQYERGVSDRPKFIQLSALQELYKMRPSPPSHPPAPPDETAK